MAKLTPDAVRALLAQGIANRAAEVGKVMESFGGRLVGYYVADGGEWDIVAIFEVADTISMATLAHDSLRVYGAGAHVRSLNVFLSTPESVDAGVPPVELRSVVDK